MKKKVFKMILLAVVMFCIFSVPVLAASDNISSCDSVINSNVIIDRRIPEVVSTIVKVIQIAVPVLLVVMGSIDLMKGVMAGKEDEVKKGQQMFIKRLISGVLVFFVFVIVELIVSFAAGSKDNKNIMTCAKCFINGDCEYR